jgi:hypothetical protein
MVSHNPALWIPIHIHWYPLCSVGEGSFWRLLLVIDSFSEGRKCGWGSLLSLWLGMTSLICICDCLGLLSAARWLQSPHKYTLRCWAAKMYPRRRILMQRNYCCSLYWCRLFYFDPMWNGLTTGGADKRITSRWLILGAIGCSSDILLCRAQWSTVSARISDRKQVVVVVCVGFVEVEWSKTGVDWGVALWLQGRADSVELDQSSQAHTQSGSLVQWKAVRGFERVWEGFEVLLV